VPKGKITPYREIAKALGKRGQIYRAVGRAMANNPFAPEVPCHRVVLSNGRIGNYSATGGIKRKIELLESEGIEIECKKRNNKIKHFEKVLYRF